MDTIPSKPPHKKLQNDVAGIDIDIGSIYVIPAATDYVDDEDLGPLASAPHQLINFGPNHEKLLIIPDYRVTRVVPGVERRKLISSGQMVKEAPETKDGDQSTAVKTQEGPEKKSEKTHGDTSSSTSSTSSKDGQCDSRASPSSPSPADLERLLSVSFRERNNAQTLTTSSPLTSLQRFEGAEGAVLLDMFESWGITTLKSLTTFPNTHSDGVALLNETGMFSDIIPFAQQVKLLLDNPPKPANPPSSTSAFIESPSNGQLPTNPSLFDANNRAIDLGASRVYPSGRINAVGSSPATTTANTAAPPTTSSHAPSLAPIPLSQVPGITPGIAEMLARYAIILTAQDLIAFPTRYPGLYNMMKDAREVEDLDALIAAAGQVCQVSSAAAERLASPPSSNPSNNNNLTSSSLFNHLGEAQRSQVHIQDVTRNTLVGALKGMSPDLASQLATLYPPIQSLQALATFAEVNPTEYTYILRSHPELPELCQQAALLVSVATGHPRPSSQHL